jgi:hypothetical protein
MTGIDHPFFENPQDLSNDELEKKHSDILNRLRIARGMHMHPEVLNQIDLLLNSIEIEKHRRAALDDQPNGVVLDTDPIVLQKFNIK